MGGTNFEGTFEIYCLDDSVVIGNRHLYKGMIITTVTSDEEGNIDVGYVSSVTMQCAKRQQTITTQ